MDRFDIVNQLKDFASSKGWHFIYGSTEYANADKHAYAVDEMVLVCELSLNPKYAEGGGLDAMEYSGLIMLGRKCEATTRSKLDETMQQKHDRRLRDLWEALTMSLGAFACSNSLSISANGGEQLINFFATNIDFVKYNVTFTD